MASPISEWQQQLNLEGSVTFRQAARRIVVCLIGSILFVVVRRTFLATDSASWWAIGGVGFFGAGVLAFWSSGAVGAGYGLPTSHEGATNE
jgi:hypothetical protein